MITAKSGLLFRDGQPVNLPEADLLALRYGFVCAEQLRDALAQLSPERREQVLILALERARSVMEHVEGLTPTDQRKLVDGMSEAIDALELFGPKKTPEYWENARTFSFRRCLTPDAG